MKTRLSMKMVWLVICLTCQFAVDGWAQSYPTRVIRLIVPTAAGSGSDFIGRVFAEGLTDVFGQRVIVDNRGGASGNIGMEIGARSPADGYTLVQIMATTAINAARYRNLRYDLIRDFAPVIQTASTAAVVVVNPSLPVKSLSQLVELAKNKPGAMNYSSGGVGTYASLSTEKFLIQTGVNIVHVPYKGTADALTSVLSGETAVTFAPFSTALPHIQQGRLRALAVTGAKRLRLLGEVPTIAEAGFAGCESSTWYGLVVPVKTPKETIAIIHKSAMSALNNPTVSTGLEKLGCTVVGGTPEEFAAHIKSEVEELRKVIEKLNLTIQ